MLLDLDPASPVPLYRQIVDQVRRSVAIGALRSGDRFLTVRELAARARVNRNTAARAIQELERSGLVRTRVGQGTFILDGQPVIEPAARESAIDELLDRLLVEAHTLGHPLEDLAGRLAERIESFQRERQSSTEGRPAAAPVPGDAPPEDGA